MEELENSTTGQTEFQRITEMALKLFVQFGVKSVTMDQISQACSISKKTLYKHVDNKEDLILQTFTTVETQMRHMIMDIANRTHGNAIDKLFALEQFAQEHLREDFEHLIKQLDQYYPRISDVLKSRREEIMFSFTRANLREGIEEGLYRADLKIDHITLLYYGHILATHENVIHATFNRDELRKTSLYYHIRGIASSQGLEYLNTLINKQL